MRLRFRLLLLALVLISSLWLVACGQEAADDDAIPIQPESQTPATEASADIGSTIENPGDTASPDASAAADDTSDAGAEGTHQINFAAMLAAMDTYLLELELSFNGQDAAGIPVAFGWRSREFFQTDPPGRRIDLVAVDDGGQGELQSMTLVRLDDLGYMYVPEIGCVGGSAEQFASDMKHPLDPAELLAGLSDIQPTTGGADDNGLGTTEFRFDASALTWTTAGPWVVDGKAFIQEGSGYLTKVEMIVAGQGDLLDEGRVLNGTFDIAIDINTVEGDTAVVVPDTCHETFRYPITQDAFDITAIEDLLAFKSRLPLVDVVNLYLNEMTSASWQLLAEPDIFDDWAILNYEADGGSLMITVEYDSETEVVSVLLSP